MLPGRYNKAWKGGIQDGISLCCIMFFEDVWSNWKHPHWRRPNDLKNDYGGMMHALTGNAGVILCPDCVADRLYKPGKPVSYWVVEAVRDGTNPREPYG